MLWNTLNQTVELGWDFYVPVILFVALIALAVPVWAAIGTSAILMLVMSGDLPLSLVGEKLFTGIDAFALTAVPLFILTGDVLVRTGLSRKFLDVAEALTCFAKGGFGSATVLVCGMFAAISGSDAAGAAAVGRMTIARLVESGYPRPYACALVAAGACTGILIPPSIAYIIIGLVLGISASTLFLAALIPGLLILISILITNLIMNRIYAYEGGGQMSMAEWGRNLVRSLKSGWYAFIVPGIIFYGIFFRPPHPDRSRCNCRRRHHRHGVHPAHTDVGGLSRNADQFGQGERRDPAHHRLFGPAGRSAGDHGRATRLCCRRHGTDGRTVAVDPVDDRHSGRGRLRHGNDPKHRDPGPDPETVGRQHRYERNPVLHHDDHGFGRWVHHPAFGAEPLCCLWHHRRVRFSRSQRAPYRSSCVCSLSS